MLHVHDLDHVKIDMSVTLDSFDGIDDELGQWVGQSWVDLGVEGSAANFDQKISGDLWGLLERIKEPEDLSLAKVDTISDDSWVDSLTDVSLGLAHELTDEEDIGGGTISSDIILGGSGATNHGGSWMLDLLQTFKCKTLSYKEFPY